MHIRFLDGDKETKLQLPLIDEYQAFQSFLFEKAKVDKHSPFTMLYHDG